MINMTSLTSLNYNSMEDRFDKNNRQAFKASINDPNLGYGDSIFDLKGKSSIYAGFPGAGPTNAAYAGGNQDNMRVTRKRSSMYNYEQFPGNVQRNQLAARAGGS